MLAFKDSKLRNSQSPPSRNFEPSEVRQVNRCNNLIEVQSEQGAQDTLGIRKGLVLLEVGMM